jgi:predicted DNA-binding protein YlxM (UPF0122 family)
MSTAISTVDARIDDPDQYPPQKINLSEALKFRYQNKLSYQEIADRYGVTKQAVHAKLKKFQDLLMEPDEAEAFRDKEVEIVRNVRFKLLEGMIDPEKIKDASINNLAYAQSQLFRDESVLTGRPTDIYDSFSVTANLEDLQKREQELLKKIEVKIVQSGEDPPIKEGKVGKE